MKTYSILILSMIFASKLVGQIHFPLGIGDNWVYQSYVPADDGSLIVYVIDKDSTIQGKKYSVFESSYSAIGTRFLRQEGFKVFGYNQIDSIDYTILDFSAKVGDTISVHSKKTKVIVALGNLQFKEIDSSNILFPEETWTIKDSVGVVNIYSKPGYYTNLMSATINGKLIASVFKRNEYFIPNNPILYQNYPNPFNPSTTIEFSIPRDANISLKLFDLLGRELFTVFEGKSSAGIHTYVLQLKNLSSGIYLYKLQSDNFSITKKLFLLK